jgi:tRNA-Thr(GGU) m(6)t(6)A37 methyltransferase TsaA
LLRPIGFIQSALRGLEEAPKQGSEGAPDAWLDVNPQVADALQAIEAGDELLLVTWLHKARRDVLTGVFATRSPDRPNPLGLHRVKVLEVAKNKLKVGPLEAIDGTPVVDIKPVLITS